MLKDHHGNKDLWRHYLLYCQSLYSCSVCVEISSIYGDCVQSLLERVSDKEESEVTETDIFDIFIQLCHFWHQAGHTEKTIAAFQAMIELNFFCPENLEQSTALSAQFGESEAKGWNHWMNMKEKGGWQQTATSSTAAVNEEDDRTLDPSLSKVEAWMMEESARGCDHMLPWRPDPGQTTDDCDDPDRLVLFDDISKVLFKLTGKNAKFQLVLGLLELLGIQNEAMLTTNSSHAHKFLHTVIQSAHQLLYAKFAISLDGEDFNRECVVSSWHSTWVKSCPGILRICEVTKGDKTTNEIKSKSVDTTTESKRSSEFVDYVIDQIIPKISDDRQSVLRLMQLSFHLTNVTLSDEPKARKKQIKSVQKRAKGHYHRRVIETI
ncbi:hypothetical protein BSL78_07933 [Apostichopus japonicus]|uniref:Uncharacterized protein n=1 Tax=Stichopus japonicus TaxID=307972 RepID=A0A2G8L4K8_STIJA|nr:hypothetical protein BSL78_07933 [Apostichopus japonicus]